jgi:hypothetical protein
MIFRAEDLGGTMPGADDQRKAACSIRNHKAGWRKDAQKYRQQGQGRKRRASAYSAIFNSPHNLPSFD